MTWQSVSRMQFTFLLCLRCLAVDGSWLSICSHVRVRAVGAVVTSLYVTVKYLREVTPYFRKASIISEVGWELQRGFLSGAPPSPSPSPPRADTRYLPLQLCHLLRPPDQGEYTHQYINKVSTTGTNIVS